MKHSDLIKLKSQFDSILNVMEKAIIFCNDADVEFLFFTTQAGESGIEVRYEKETIWLTQKTMAELFTVSVPTINEHLKNIFDSSKLTEDSVIRKFRTTASDGKEYNTHFYNLDVIISVGYRVNSVRATQFRQWARKVLKEFSAYDLALNEGVEDEFAFLKPS